MERLAILNAGQQILPDDLPRDLTATTPAAGGGEVGPRIGQSVSLEDLERAHIEAVLEKENWHQGKAADTLGISPKTLYRKIRAFELERS
jgi:two-component system NtrC family response regulator